MPSIEKVTSAKSRLERLIRLLMKINPGLFEIVDASFNIPRYIDVRNLSSLFKNHYGKVLEVGCGKGYFFDFFTKRGDGYYGIDIDFDEIDCLKKRTTVQENNNHNKVVMGDGASLPFLDNSFDLVFCNCVIEHIHEDEAVLREASRVLKPGGEMVFTFPTSTYEPTFLKKFLFTHKTARWLADPGLLHYFDFSTLGDAENWYVRERWAHERRGYCFEELDEYLQKLNTRITNHFYYFTQPLASLWELCTFSRLNCLFPFSLLLFAPLMRCMGVTKHGKKDDSLILAIRAIKE